MPFIFITNSIALDKNEKYQEKHKIFVNICVCNFLESETKNNTFLAYDKILNGCNDIVENKLRVYPKSYKPTYYLPKINQLDCKEIANAWKKSKR